MTTTAIDIPLARGQSSKVDPKLMPNGVLKRAENMRFRRDARVGKRYGNAIVAPPVGTGPTHALATDAGAPSCVVNGAYSVRDSSGAWASLGLISRFLPEREVKAFATSGQSLRGSVCAYSGGLVGAATVDISTNQLAFRVFDASTWALVASSTLTASGTVSGLRAVAVTSGVAFLVLDGTDIKQVLFSTSGKTFAAPATVVSSVTAAGGFDACEFAGGTQYLLSYQSAANSITIAKCTPTPSVSVAATFVAAADTLFTAVADCTERIYVAWYEVTNQKVRAMSFDPTLFTAASLVDVATSSVNGGLAAPVICRADATHAYVFWNQTDIRSLSWRTISDASVLGATKKSYALNFASKPFPVSSEPYLWVSQGEVSEIDLTYHLVSLATGQATNFNDVFRSQLVCGEHVACGFAGDIPSNVYTTASGYVSGMPMITARESADSVTRGYSLVSFSRGGTEARESRSTTQARSTELVAGGRLVYSDGSTLGVIGFGGAPLIRSATPVGVGSMTSSVKYSYVLTYEFTDARGQRHQSAPSLPVTATMGGTDVGVDLVIRGLSIASSSGVTIGLPATDAPTIVVWRTLADGTIYYRHPTNRTAYTATGGATFHDTAADTALASDEILYTQGGILENDNAPSCRLIVAGADRVLVAGLFDPTAYRFSKQFTPGLPVQFAADAGLFSGNVPGDITALAHLDGVWVIFTRDEIYTVAGDGPDDQGQGAFDVPRKLPSPVGCIDARSVCSTPVGIAFQGANGLYVLPRGFGAPTLVRDLEDVLEAYPIVTSATLLSTGKESFVRWTVVDADPAVNGRTMTIDLRTDEWILDTIGPIAHAAVWNGAWTACAANTSSIVPIIQEGSSSFADLGVSFIPTTLELGDLRPFGIQGRGLVRRIHVLGEYRGPCTLKAEASYDDGVTYSDSVTWNLTGLTAGATVRREWQLSRQQLDSVRLRLSDANLSGPSEGFVFNALSVHVERKKGLRRRPPGER